jgi:hypothetical protein
VIRHLDSTNLMALGIDRPVRLTPDPAPICAVPAHLPLTFTPHLEPGAVHTEVQSLASGTAGDGHRQVALPAREGAVSAAPASSASPCGAGFP